MDVTAQWVRTTWTKQSRGGEEAARRNALPVAFTLPETTRPLVHTVTQREWDHDFEPQFSVLHGPPSRDEVQLREADGLLRIMLLPRGTPGAIRRRPPAVRLRPGEWVRWQITYRRASFSGTGPWYYSLETLNLAFGPVSTKDVFLGLPPLHVDERAQLTTYRDG
ncbi:hypothetical protein [Allokutzneria albata]|uniref:Uncharacterized protein n=1 Tax=Allokutzneria albata TaxID=211114 RepID=A0A1G9TWI7_ALLAB|nr:hypothetical protein [Allokutzneria albata]SDM51625.1 hypothetical protein SAMN04489726_2015 [Allokutzneria albata]